MSSKNRLFREIILQKKCRGEMCFARLFKNLVYVTKLKPHNFAAQTIACKIIEP